MIIRARVKTPLKIPKLIWPQFYSTMKFKGYDPLDEIKKFSKLNKTSMKENF